MASLDKLLIGNSFVIRHRSLLISQRDLSFWQQIPYHRFLIPQLINRSIDLCATKVVNSHALYDFDLLAIAANRKRADKSFFNSITAIRAKANTVPIARLCRLEDRPDTIHNCIGSAGGAGSATCFDHRSPALLNRSNEFAL